MSDNNLAIFSGDHSASASSSPLLEKANSINSYWWPSVKDGGLLGKIYATQHPLDCSSPSTKFFVWRSSPQNEKDTRGLTAWAHSGTYHLLHAFTDGDQFPTFASRVLINDDKLWPMVSCFSAMQCFASALHCFVYQSVHTHIIIY